MSVFLAQLRGQSSVINDHLEIEGSVSKLSPVSQNKQSSHASVIVSVIR